VLYRLEKNSGLILFVIPGIWIGVRMAVSVEALVVAGLLTGLVNAVITTPFNNTSWFVQAIAAAIATVITMPYGVLVGVLLYLDLRARKEQLSLERLRTDLQASAT